MRLIGILTLLADEASRFAETAIPAEPAASEIRSYWDEYLLPLFASAVRLPGLVEEVADEWGAPMGAPFILSCRDVII